MSWTKEKRDMLYEQMKEAYNATFSGWDFSYIEQFGGKPEFQVPWNYAQAVKQKIPAAESMLDLGTGGGEYLTSLGPLPINVAATEAYEPNVAVAEKTLAPLGIKVIKTDYGAQEQDPLPFEDCSFDLITSRHESYESMEIYRILKPGGIFITQQVGTRNSERLRTIFGVLDDQETSFDWNLQNARKFLLDAGMEIDEASQSVANQRFYDIRSVVYFLKVIEWEFPHFSLDNDLGRLENIALLIERDGYFEDICHRFFLVARKLT